MDFQHINNQSEENDQVIQSPPPMTRHIKVHNLDITNPVDINTPVDSLGGNNKLYFAMLSRLEGMSLSMCMQQITDAVDNKEWLKMKNAAHSLKGASGYVGASKVHYACYYIQKAFNANNHQEMIEYYPLIVEACIEYKRYSRKFIARENGKNLFENLN